MTTTISKAIWRNWAVPLALLALYFNSFSRFLAWLVPEYPANVNAAFAVGAWRLALLAAGLALAAALALRFVPAGRREVAEKPAGLNLADGLLLLLPLTPIFQYVLNNQDVLSLANSLFLLGVFAGGSVFFILVLPWGLRAWLPPARLALLGLAFVFSITNMASLSGELAWHEKGQLPVQTAMLAGVFAVGWILSARFSRKLLYLLIVAFFGVNSVMQLGHIRREADPAAAHERPVAGDHPLVGLIGTKVPARTPDIFLLAYDSYVGNDTLRHYGLENGAHEGYLVRLGFQIYPRIYSIGADSCRSMSRALNVSPDFYGSMRTAVSGNGVVPNLLARWGYTTYGIFHGDYFFQGVPRRYAHSFPMESSNLGRALMKSVFMGEFRFDAKFNSDSDAPRFVYQDFQDYKRRVLKAAPRTPRFVYAHTPIPGHSQNSGACLPNETALYAGRLQDANREMQADLALLLAKNPGAIVIVAGDHGPYLTKNCKRLWADYDISEINRQDIQDRYGVFLAIRWPTEDFAAYDDITVLQDVFVSVLAYLCQDESLLAAKVAPVTREPWVTSGAYVTNGIIAGGRDDGQPLFPEPDLPAPSAATPPS